MRPEPPTFRIHAPPPANLSCRAVGPVKCAVGREVRTQGSMIYVFAAQGLDWIHMCARDKFCLDTFSCWACSLSLCRLQLRLISVSRFTRLPPPPRPPLLIPLEKKNQGAPSRLFLLSALRRTAMPLVCCGYPTPVSDPE